MKFFVFLLWLVAVVPGAAAQEVPVPVCDTLASLQADIKKAMPSLQFGRMEGEEAAKLVQFGAPNLMKDNAVYAVMWAKLPNGNIGVAIEVNGCVKWAGNIPASLWQKAIEVVYGQGV